MASGSGLAPKLHTREGMPLVIHHIFHAKGASGEVDSRERVQTKPQADSDVFFVVFLFFCFF